MLVLSQFMSYIIYYTLLYVMEHQKLKVTFPINLVENFLNCFYVQTFTQRCKTNKN